MKVTDIRRVLMGKGYICTGCLKQIRTRDRRISMRKGYTCTDCLKQIRARDITVVIKDLVKLYYRLYKEDAKEINFGSCELFAGDVTEILPEAEAFWGDAFSPEFWGLSEEDVKYLTGGHCFVLYMGKFYDSEAPFGVDHPRDLPFFIREAEWKKHWKRPS